jgi:TetR/AcrR family transcriptional regulator, cholesterol catabolism regulator
MVQTLADPKTDKKLQIIAAACGLFKTIGIKNLTMDDLANVTGILKKTLYQFFNGKTALIECVITDIIRQKKEALREARLFSSNAVEQAFLGWHVMQEFLQTINPEVSEELRNHYPQAYYVVSEFQDVFLYNNFKLNIETGITQELYRNNIKTEIIARYLVQILLLAGSIPMLSNGKFGYLETEDQILSYHLHAIATDKGAKLIRKYKNELLAHTAHLR